MSPDLPAQRVLVTGGAGFVGSHLCRSLLAAGCEVICIDNFLSGAAENVVTCAESPRFALIEHDICEPFEISGRLDRIYNLACAASPPRYQADPVHTMMTCVQGTGHLLDLAERHGARFLQASTSEIYGDPEQHPQREDYRGHVSCTGPRACYDEGKRAAETLCFDMLRQARVDVRVARIFNTYGPNMRRDDGRVVSSLIMQALAGEQLTIYGQGLQTRSFCYVSDLVSGLRKLMETGCNPGGPVNLGNPKENTVLELAETVLRLTGSSSSLVFGELPADDPKRRRPDITLARERLGWRPLVPLERGLRSTIAFFRERYDMPVEAAPPRAMPSHIGKPHGAPARDARGAGEANQ